MNIVPYTNLLRMQILVYQLSLVLFIKFWMITVFSNQFSFSFDKLVKLLPVLFFSPLHNILLSILPILQNQNYKLNLVGLTSMFSVSHYLIV